MKRQNGMCLLRTSQAKYFTFFSLFLQWDFLIYCFKLVLSHLHKLRKLPGSCTNIMRFFQRERVIFSFQVILHGINNKPIGQFFFLSKRKTKLGRETCRPQDPARVDSIIWVKWLCCCPGEYGNIWTYGKFNFFNCWHFLFYTCIISPVTKKQDFISIAATLFCI